MVGVDLYNVLNSSAILTYNNVFVPGGPWLQPNSVLTRAAGPDQRASSPSEMGSDPFTFIHM